MPTPTADSAAAGAAGSSDRPRPVRLFAPGAEFPQRVAEQLLSRYGSAGRDLSHITLVLASPVLAQPLLRALSRASAGALLAPRFSNLEGLIAAHPALDAAASPLAARLRLAEACARFRFLFPGQPPLQIAEALLGLFDGLEAEAVALPDDEPALEALLQKAYGGERPLQALTREAQIVHRLHRAYLEELGERAPAVARRRAFSETLRDWPLGRPLIFLGLDALPRGWAQALAASSAEVWLQGRLDGRDGVALQRLIATLGRGVEHWGADHAPRAQLLRAAFATEGSVRDRVAAVTAAGTASSQGLAISRCRDAEHEAQCADLAVRQALLEGARHVAVVCEDRRLARRLRARLERAGLPLSDRGGWALSTSRAAATLDAWLLAAERDLPRDALLDVLKSGLTQIVADGDDRDWAQQLAERSAEAPERGGLRYWKQTAPEAEAPRWARIEKAQACLATLRERHPAQAHLEAVLASLNSLGLSTRLARDAAGQRLLSELESLHSALAQTELVMHWSAFRALLDTVLEAASFSPPEAAPSGLQVELLTLAQTAGLSSDALVITGTTAALLNPGLGTPFFNAGVRRELGLPTAAEAQQLALSRFVRALQAAPRVQLLYAPARPDEEALPAPALQALLAFADAAQMPMAENRQLAEWAPFAEIATDSEAEGGWPLPLDPPQPNAGILLPQLRARGLSAAAHQRLIECPYAWYTRYALGLSALPDPEQNTSRRDYGLRVHAILRAFHAGADHLPAPLNAPPGFALGSAERPDVEARLHALADAMFAPDLASRPLARFWRQEFAALTPWLTEQLTCHPHAAVRCEIELSAERHGTRLFGTVDRLEDDGHERRVVDYKTGTPPGIGEVRAGEAVQLLHYALLLQPPAAEVHYWDLKEQKSPGLDGEGLRQLLPAIEQRVQQLVEAVALGAALPAHGIAKVCERCDAIGICRRTDWNSSS